MLTKLEGKSILEILLTYLNFYQITTHVVLILLRVQKRIKSAMSSAAATCGNGNHQTCCRIIFHASNQPE